MGNCAGVAVPPDVAEKMKAKMAAMVPGASTPITAIELAGEPYQRLKENFTNKFGETYDIKLDKTNSPNNKIGIDLITEDANGKEVAGYMMIEGVHPGLPAHTEGVGVGSILVAVDGVPVATYEEAGGKIGPYVQKEKDTITLTFKRPMMGYVVATTGKFADKPTCSTWKAMGYKWEDIPKAFGGKDGPSFGTCEDREVFQYFYEARQRNLSIITKCGKHGSPEMRHHTDEMFPQMLADAPYWEAKCMEDEKFKAFAAKHLKNHTLPLKCDELGVPMPFTDNNDAHGPEYIMSARLGDIDKADKEVVTYTDQKGRQCQRDADVKQIPDAVSIYLSGGYKNIGSERYHVARAEYLGFNSCIDVEIVPYSEYEKHQRNPSMYPKYWDIEVGDADGQKGHVFVYKDEDGDAPEKPGVWRIKEGGKKIMVLEGQWGGEFNVSFQQSADRYTGVAPAGCGFFPWMFRNENEH